MKRFNLLIKLFKFDYHISNDIYHIFPKYSITNVVWFCIKFIFFTKLLKFTSISPDYCAMFTSKAEVEVYLDMNRHNKFAMIMED